MADRGTPLTTSVLRKFVVAIIQRNGKPTRINLEKGPSMKWIRIFFARNPELKKRKPDRADNGRLKVTREEVDEYFQLLEKTINELKVTPDQIFNVDETGFDGHEQSREKVIVVGKQHPYQQQMTTGIGHITLNLAISGAGRYLPPMVIFSKNVPRDLETLPDSWNVTSSKKGYMDSTLFVDWLSQSFIPNCGRDRPVLLIMDNLGAHLTPDAIDLARENQVEMLCLPPHSTHLLQPLDVRIFHLLKTNLSKVASRLGHQVNRISRGKMPDLIKYALSMLSEHDIIEAFRLTGIIPCNPSIVTLLKQTLSKRTDIENEGNPNHLVNMGIVPAALADILVPPPPRRGKKRFDGARLITAPDTLQQSTSNNATEVQPSTSASVTPDEISVPVEEYPDDGICVVCMTNQRLEWIGCDRCDNWFHYACLNRENQVLVDLSVVTGDTWSCGFCEEE
ncbi:uncharacterized protein LOC128554944 [Mercenaria mercenaria]|uniref:uncharacterized protein LOC128554944 n=1 Tax=Mercenaria mercenaria TaxID=6596 RepID=UPI00234EC5C0|nr:uncharacterized protein LOC128554944 [Mercenaria mercenaria]